LFEALRGKTLGIRGGKEHLRKGGGKNISKDSISAMGKLTKAENSGKSCERPITKKKVHKRKQGGSWKKKSLKNTKGLGKVQSYQKGGRANRQRRKEKAFRRKKALPKKTSSGGRGGRKPWSASKR